MALTFEGGSAARLENGRSLRNFEEVVVALMLLAIVTVYKSLNNNMIYH